MIHRIQAIFIHGLVLMVLILRINPSSTLKATLLPQCFHRDQLGHHESFCLVTLCRDADPIWKIPLKDLQTLARNGEDHILERIWNFGPVTVVVNASTLPAVNDPPNNLVLINNANHGSAHLAMYFAFPAISIVHLLQGHFNVVGVRHRIPDYNVLAQDVPWVREFLPILQEVLLSPSTPSSIPSSSTPSSPAPPHRPQRTVPVPTIGHGYQHPTLSCHRSVLFHEVDMRGRFSSIEVLPRWFFTQEIAQQTAALVETHTKDGITPHETHLLQMSPCQVVLILRKHSLQGTATARHINNENRVAKALDRYFQTNQPTFASVCRVYFDHTSLGYQVQRIRRAKVVVAVHGAALTNVAWMQSCGILLEIFPSLVWNHGMYKGLTHDVGGVYRSVASVENVANGCISKYVKLWGNNLKRECTHDMECSSCSRLHNVTVDVVEMVGKLSGAWEEREACLQGKRGGGRS